MGSRNTLEVRSHVKSGTWLGDDCVIGTVCTTNEGEVLEDKTVIYGINNERRIYSASREALGLSLPNAAKVQSFSDVLVLVRQDVGL
ncbi:hypothetical protein BGX20_000517 [Mortierella sp. AD010]|nr:hypothetical protein BGX20_000517 [Mortierella sp. AD010]